MVAKGIPILLVALLAGCTSEPYHGGFPAGCQRDELTSADFLAAIESTSDLNRSFQRLWFDGRVNNESHSFIVAYVEGRKEMYAQSFDDYFPTARFLGSSYYLMLNGTWHHGRDHRPDGAMNPWFESIKDFYQNLSHQVDADFQSSIPRDMSQYERKCRTVASGAYSSYSWTDGRKWHNLSYGDDGGFFREIVNPGTKLKVGISFATHLPAPPPTPQSTVRLPFMPEYHVREIDNRTTAQIVVSRESDVVPLADVAVGFRAQGTDWRINLQDAGSWDTGDCRGHYSDADADAMWSAGDYIHLECTPPRDWAIYDDWAGSESRIERPVFAKDPR